MDGWMDPALPAGKYSGEVSSLSAHCMSPEENEYNHRALYSLAMQREMCAVTHLSNLI